MRSNERRTIVDELSGYRTFAACSRDDLEALVDAGGHFALPPQWSLLQEGIPADAAYVILEGTARVFRERDVVATLGPGDLVGEMALLVGGQRSATVSSVTRLSGLRIDYAALTSLLTQRPRLTEAIRTVADERRVGAATG
ncbi:MAG: family transcriptional regulator, cyclic receptor protein [Pseudonocardiales bacterium]|jgi:CRP-like cAMP-binding protein|nr:family transcriptional regulator, cyclic receptor protein [Pseudonocardiales bacterium]